MPIVLTAAVALVAAALLLPGLLLGPSIDAAAFALVADELRTGGTLYVDAWDHKPPGMYLLIAVGRSVLPFLSAWQVSWLLSLAATVIVGVALYRALADRGVGSVSAAMAALLAVVAMGQYLTALGGGLTEPVAAAFAAIGVAIVMRGQGARAPGLGAGGLLGLATVTSLQLLPGAAAVAVMVGARRIPLYAIGFMAVWAGILLALIGMGAGGAAADALVRYPDAYRAASAEFGGALSAAPFAWTLLSFLALLVTAASGGLAPVRAGGSAPRVRAAAVIWLLGASVLFLAQGRFIAHYAIPLVIPLGLLAGHGIERLVHRPAAATIAGRFIPLVVLGVTVVVSIVAGAAGGQFEAQSAAAQDTRIAETAEVIADVSEPGTTMLVWGNQPALHLAADRPPALRYGFMFPLTTPGYVTPALIEEAAAELRSMLPAVVVDAGSPRPGAPGYLPLLIDRPVVREGRELDLLDPLRAVVAEHYRLDTTATGWPVYVLREAGSQGGRR